MSAPDAGPPIDVAKTDTVKVGRRKPVAKDCCAGKNECKGKSGCQVAGNECKGMNDCKGSGTACP